MVAMSSGVPSRFSGVCEMIRCRDSSSNESSSGHSTGPGATALTRIPSGPNSWAAVRVGDASFQRILALLMVGFAIVILLDPLRKMMLPPGTEGPPGGTVAEARPPVSGLGFSIAVGIRYSHGRGDTLGVVLPAVYDPNAIEVRRVATKINDIDFNFGVKVLF